MKKIAIIISLLICCMLNVQSDDYVERRIIIPQPWDDVQFIPNTDSISVQFDIDFPADSMELIKYPTSYDHFSGSFDSTIIYHKREIDYGAGGSFVSLWWNQWNVATPGFLIYLILPYKSDGRLCCTSIELTVKERNFLFHGVRFPIGYVGEIPIPHPGPFIQTYPNDTIVKERCEPYPSGKISCSYSTINTENGYINIVKSIIAVSPFYFDAAKRDVYLSKLSIVANYRPSIDKPIYNPPSLKTYNIRELLSTTVYNYFYDFERFYPNITGIKQTIDIPEENEAEAPMYDLLGRTITEPIRGNIYVKNGRKFIYR